MIHKYTRHLSILLFVGIVGVSAFTVTMKFSTSYALQGGLFSIVKAASSPTPTASATPTPVASISPTPTPTVSPAPTPSVSPTPTPVASVSPVASPTPTVVSSPVTPVEVSPTQTTRFLRGDANQDGVVDISDAVRISDWFASRVGEINCLDSADANDNGRVDGTDISLIQNYLFSNGPTPKAPFPVPGVDPSSDNLTCDSYIVDTSITPKATPQEPQINIDDTKEKFQEAPTKILDTSKITATHYAQNATFYRSPEKSDLYYFVKEGDTFVWHKVLNGRFLDHWNINQDAIVFLEQPSIDFLLSKYDQKYGLDVGVNPPANTPVQIGDRHVNRIIPLDSGVLNDVAVERIPNEETFYRHYPSFDRVWSRQTRSQQGVSPDGGGAGGIPFRRGDANNDGEVNLSDGVYVLNFLFTGGQTPSCLDAADTDDSGELTLTDGVFIFDYLFRGGAIPSAPGPNDEGVDPTTDNLDCDEYNSSEPEVTVLRIQSEDSVDEQVAVGEPSAFLGSFTFEVEGEETEITSFELGIQMSRIGGIANGDVFSDFVDNLTLMNQSTGEVVIENVEPIFNEGSDIFGKAFFDADLMLPEGEHTFSVHGDMRRLADNESLRLSVLPTVEAVTIGEREIVEVEPVDSEVLFSRVAVLRTELRASWTPLENEFVPSDGREIIIGGFFLNGWGEDVIIDNFEFDVIPTLNNREISIVDLINIVILKDSEGNEITTRDLPFEGEGVNGILDLRAIDGGFRVPKEGVEVFVHAMPFIDQFEQGESIVVSLSPFMRAIGANTGVRANLFPSNGVDSRSVHFAGSSGILHIEYVDDEFNEFPNVAVGEPSALLGSFRFEAIGADVHLDSFTVAAHIGSSNSAEGRLEDVLSNVKFVNDQTGEVIVEPVDLVYNEGLVTDAVAELNVDLDLSDGSHTFSFFGDIGPIDRESFFLLGILPTVQAINAATGESMTVVPDQVEVTSTSVNVRRTELRVDRTRTPFRSQRATGREIPIGNFRLAATGEDVDITSFSFDFLPRLINRNAPINELIARVVVKDSEGNEVSLRGDPVVLEGNNGTVNVSALGAGFRVPQGSTEIFIHAVPFADAFYTGEKIIVRFNEQTQARGVRTGVEAFFPSGQVLSQPVEFIGPNGFMTVQIDASSFSDPRLVVAGTSQVPVIDYRLRTILEPVDITSISIRADDAGIIGTNDASFEQIDKVYILNDGVIVGNPSGYVMSAETITIPFNRGDLTVPNNDQGIFLSVVADLALIGVNEPGKPNADVSIGLNDSDDSLGIIAIGNNSNLGVGYLRPTPTAPFVIHKAFPQVRIETPPNALGATSVLHTAHITAVGGDIGIQKLSYRTFTSSDNVRVLDTFTRLTSCSSCDGIASGSQLSETFSSETERFSTFEIPVSSSQSHARPYLKIDEGATAHIDFVGTVSLTADFDSVTTRMSGDLSEESTSSSGDSALDLGAEEYFIWSDLHDNDSLNAGALTEEQWYNGYLVEGIWPGNASVTVAD